MEILKELKAGKVKDLKQIKIASGLQVFPQELFILEDTLEILDLSNNNLSILPDDFYRFKKLRILFLSNNKFDHVPKVLSKLSFLSMFGIRNNHIKSFDENALPLSIRWLILTDNNLECLPESIGDLLLLQKFMLSGNQLSSLPKTLNKCKNLELLRISSNKLKKFPKFILSLPKLSWLAYSDNPFCKKHLDSNASLVEIHWNKLEIKELLGEGASGSIYKAIYTDKEVAVKIFKGEMTSDGLPQEEMDINISMGVHKNLIDVLGFVSNHPFKKDALILELISSEYINLASPPSFETCTRDVYPFNFTLTIESSLKILQGILSAAVHMHERAIIHGDFYAHNIMIDTEFNSILGDFGGASYYKEEEQEIKISLQQLEVRAFGCLLEELLNLSKNDTQNIKTRDFLFKLKIQCLNQEPKKRPLFKDIVKQLENIL